MKFQWRRISEQRIRFDAQIDAYVVNYNLHRRPFIWTATADSILTRLHPLCSAINGTSHESPVVELLLCRCRLKTACDPQEVSHAVSPQLEIWLSA
jgi:hypothetical protein